MNKYLFFSSTLIIVFIAIVIVREIRPNLNKVYRIDQNSVGSPSSQDYKSQTLHLAFVGDMMFDRGVLLRIQKYGANDLVGTDGDVLGLDYDFPLDLVRDRLVGYDMTFGNLEGPVSNRGTKRGSIYSFHMDPKTVTALSHAGFDAVSVANNHIGDWGVSAMHDTFASLVDAGIIAVGGGYSRAEAYGPKYFHIEPDFTIALIGASEFGAGYTEAPKITSTKVQAIEYGGVGIAVLDSSVNSGSNSELINSIKTARQNANLVIVSLHFGDEYRTTPTDFQRRTSQAFVDAGADIVIGHHPHVLEPVEEYTSSFSGKSGLIAYSMGNFIFDQYFSTTTMSSAILEVDVVKVGSSARFADHSPAGLGDNKLSLIKDWRLIPVKINEYFQPYILESQNDHTLISEQIDE